VVRFFGFALAFGFGFGFGFGFALGFALGFAFGGGGSAFRVPSAALALGFALGLGEKTVAFLIAIIIALSL
tara:strand:+ start:1507 stop:1719 length:213 start_codon:yes stop_codon:yes gene_type:complete